MSWNAVSPIQLFQLGRSVFYIFFYSSIITATYSKAQCRIASKLSRCLSSTPSVIEHAGNPECLSSKTETPRRQHSNDNHTKSLEHLTIISPCLSISPRFLDQKSAQTRKYTNQINRRRRSSETRRPADPKPPPSRFPCPSSAAG